MTLQRLLMLFISLTPVVLAGLIWNLSIDSSNSSTTSVAPSNNRPDALIQNLTYSQFSASGHLVQQLETVSAISHVSGEEVELLQPDLLVAGDNQTQWAASSNSGYLDRPGSQLVLNGDVVLRRLGSAPAQLTTDSLTWLPASASAYTNDLVTIDAPGNYMQAQGVSIDLDKSTFIFHSNVRGIHEIF